MSKQKRLLVITLFLIVVIAGLFYFYPPRFHPLPVTSYIQDFGNSSLIDLNDEQLQEGGSFEVTDNSLAHVNLPNGNYTLQFNPEQTEQGEKIVLFYDGTSITLEDGQSERLDLNADGKEDVIVSITQSPNSADRVYIKALTSENDEGLGDSDLGKTLSALESAARKQSYLIFGLLILIFFILLAFLIKTFIAPAYKLKSIQERSDPVKMVKYLISELEDSAGNPKKAMSVLARLKHFYNYLSKEDQEKVNKEVRAIKRYIN